MIRVSTSISISIVALVIAGCGGTEQDEALVTRLAAARSGDVIAVRAGSYSGPLTVPPGVSLVADGPATIEPGDGDATVTIETASGQTTRLVGFTISGANVAVAVGGDGTFEGESLEIVCNAGVGLAVEAISSLSLRQSSVVGGLTEPRAKEITFPHPLADTPTIGIALSKVAEASLEQVSVSGFAGFGAALVDSAASWIEGTVEKNLGVGLIVEGGSLQAKQLDVRQTWAGELGMAVLAYGLIVAKDATVTTEQLSVSEVAGFGVVQDHANAIHRKLQIKDNDDVGLWLQSSTASGSQPALSIGQQSTIANNKGGGLFVLASGGVTLSDTIISNAREKPIVSASGTGAVTMADGLQLVDLVGEVTLDELELADNERVGLLLSGAPPSTGAVEMTKVTITGVGRYGLIPENGYDPDERWDVTRAPKLQQADEAFSGTLGAAAVKTGLPSVQLISSVGLKSLLASSKVGKDGLE